MKDYQRANRLPAPDTLPFGQTSHQRRRSPRPTYVVPFHLPRVSHQAHDWLGMTIAGTFPAPRRSTTGDERWWAYLSG
jgi:hypothetical protein